MAADLIGEAWVDDTGNVVGIYLIEVPDDYWDEVEPDYSQLPSWEDYGPEFCGP